jgi:hypothetical protein
MKRNTNRRSAKTERVITGVVNKIVRKIMFEALETRTMLTAPTVIAKAFHFDVLPQTITFQFDQDVSASLASGDLQIQKIGKTDTFISSSRITYSGYSSGTNTATFSYWPAGSTPLDTGNYRAILGAAGVTNGSNERLAKDGVLDLFFLAGDATHDRHVNSTDLAAIEENDGQTGSSADFTHGDLNYDGVIDASVTEEDATDRDWFNDNAGSSLPAPPPAPDGLTVVSVSSTQNDLSWVDHSAGEAGLKIQRRTNTGSWSTLYTTGPNETTYSDSGFTSGTQYWYRIRATGNGRDSAYTPARDSNTAALSAPSTPSISNVEQNSLSLSWTNNASTRTGTEIWESRDAGDYTLLTTVGASATGYNVTHLASNESYSFKLRAINSDVVSAFTSAATETTDSGDGVEALSIRFDDDTSHQIVVQFDKDVSASLSADDLLLDNVTTDTRISASNVAYNTSTKTATFTFADLLPGGNYRAVLSAEDVTDGSNFPLHADAVLDFFVLSGDFNHDRVVDMADSQIAAADIGASSATFSQGDINYDGSVDTTDLGLVGARLGATLSAPPSGPDDISVAAIDPHSLTVSWIDTVQGETGWRIQLSTDGINFTDHWNVPASKRARLQRSG